MRQMAPWVGDPPATWDLVAWPDWVPTTVREQVEGFWGPKSGRRPKDYLECVLGPYKTVPAFGERVFLGDGDPRHWHVGRYVHAWNNIGRIVRDDGVVIVVSTNYYGRPIPRPAFSDRDRLDLISQLVDEKGFLAIHHWDHDGRRLMDMKRLAGRTALLVHRFSARGGADETLRDALDAVLNERFDALVAAFTETTKPAQSCNDVQRASEGTDAKSLNPHNGGH